MIPIIILLKHLDNHSFIVVIMILYYKFGYN